MKLNNLLSLLLCIFTILSLSCALQSEDIIGGCDVKEFTFNYHVSIEVEQQLLVEKEPICGGGLIADDLVLTAAHCFLDNRGYFINSTYLVAAGSKDLNNNTRIEVYAYMIYIHVEYNPLTYANDIAVTKLIRGLNISTNAHLSKLNLPVLGESYSNQIALLSGFGYNLIKVDNNFPSSHEEIKMIGISDSRLKYIFVRILKAKECKQLNKFWNYSKQICGVALPTVEKKAGFCQGDSGGPLVIDRTVLGIASSGRLDCNQINEGGIYTRVSSYLSFVQNVIDNVTSNLTRVISNHILYN